MLVGMEPLPLSSADPKLSPAAPSAPSAINPAFGRALYESLLVAYGRILAKYNAFAQGSILRDVGREVIDYLGRHGFPLDEQGDAEDLNRLTELFVHNGFVERLEVQPGEAG